MIILLECDIRTCAIFCEHGRIFDENGCVTCACVKCCTDYRRPLQKVEPAITNALQFYNREYHRITPSVDDIPFLFFVEKT